MLGFEGKGVTKTGVNCIVGRIIKSSDMMNYVLGWMKKLSSGSHHFSTLVKWWNPAKKAVKKSQW